MSEWVIVVYRQFSNFSAISWRGQVNFQWDDDEVRFVPDQHAKLDCYSASSLKQQPAVRHVAPLWHIILIPSQPVFLLNDACLAEKQDIPIFLSLVWPDRGSNPRSTTLEANTLPTNVVKNTLLYMKRKLKQWWFNNSTNINKINNHPSPQHWMYKYSNILCWNFRPWLGTDTKMWWG